ncbi:hypothetical protein GGR53DRAFT_525862 [Hypoxylon sp. FL1150]|nr:hypothetical protein GGR53DRAFT_525862 [Hypoxylon sp. FL1150]
MGRRGRECAASYSRLGDPGAVAGTPRRSFHPKLDLLGVYREETLRGGPDGRLSTLDMLAQPGCKDSRLELARGQEEMVSKKLEYTVPRCVGTGYMHCYFWASLVTLSSSYNWRFVLGDSYLAGPWEHLLNEDLYWRVLARQSGITTTRHTSESHVPPWSWASIVGGSVVIEIMRGDKVHVPYFHVMLVQARIVTELPGGDLTGLLRVAELDIECIS